MFHDAHVHLCKNSMFKQFEELRERWETAGVSHVQCMSTTIHESKRSLDMQEMGKVFSGVGKHPWKAKRPLSVEEQDELALLVKDKRCSVIGEVGLDYHFVKLSERHEHQREAFEFFLELSGETGKPLNIHSKGAEHDLITMLREHSVDGHRVNMHWYSGPSNEMLQLIELGCFFSVGPAILYSKHRMVAEEVPLDQLMTESDGDVNFKPLGLKGEPSLIPRVVDELARIKEAEPELVREMVFDNALRYLSLKNP